jgi:hypothetical protein
MPQPTKYIKTSAIKITFLIVHVFSLFYIYDSFHGKKLYRSLLKFLKRTSIVITLQKSAG